MEEPTLIEGSGVVIKHADGNISIDYGDLVLPVMPPDMPERPEEDFDHAAFYEHMAWLRRAFPNSYPTAEERLARKADVRFVL